MVAAFGVLPLALALVTSAGAGTRPAARLVPFKLNPIVTAVEPCSQSLVFHFTGAEQSCAVPAGVSQVEIIAVGGRGGGGAPGCYGLPSTSGMGGWGAQVISPSVAVTPGEELYVEVGGVGGNAASTCGVSGQGSAGEGGWNGGGNGVLAPSDQGSGGGGGASDVRTVSCASVCDQGAGFGTLISLASRLVVAGGGGGAGSGGGAGDCQPCTSAGGAGGFAGTAGGEASFAGGQGILGVGGSAGGSSSAGAGGESDPGCGSAGDPPPCTWGSDGHIAIGGAGGVDLMGGYYVDGAFVDGYGGGGGGGGFWGGGGGDGGEVSLSNTVGGGGGGGGGSSFGPQGSIVFPDPADPYVEILPR